jgi:glycosyltransferase involved in cell wall biosynthesis
MTKRPAEKPRTRVPGVLVLGQTPPPHHGQALMIERLVRAETRSIRIHHVRLAFSSSTRSVGRFEPRKLLHLFAVIARALRIRFREDVRVLYLSPAGPNAVPVLRDVVLLAALRPFFTATVYHFHAAGISEFLERLPRPLRWLIRRVYAAPAGAIRNSALNPPDDAYLRARRRIVIPNGLDDAALPYLACTRPPSERVRILFVGMIAESKGALVLLQAARSLALRRADFELEYVGDFAADEFEDRMKTFVREQHLEDRVRFAGRRTGREKWEHYHHADMLCLPSFYEAETFGNVLVEAMMFRLPVVATRWRGIPDVVVDGVTGLLVPVRDVDALAAALNRLLDDPGLRSRMGEAGRQRYLSRFTIDEHLARLEAFLAVVAAN